MTVTLDQSASKTLQVCLHLAYSIFPFRKIKFSHTWRLGLPTYYYLIREVIVKINKIYCTTSVDRSVPSKLCAGPRAHQFQSLCTNINLLRTYILLFIMKLQ